jgi:hypothetical protein
VSQASVGLLSSSAEVRQRCAHMHAGQAQRARS